MVQQQQLYRRPVVLIVQAHWREPEGWQLLVAARREDESFDDGYRAVYTSMSLMELYDVIEQECIHRLFAG